MVAAISIIGTDQDGGRLGPGRQARQTRTPLTLSHSYDGLARYPPKSRRVPNPPGNDSVQERLLRAQQRLIDAEFQFAGLRANGLGMEHPELKMIRITLDELNAIPGIRTEDYWTHFEQRRTALVDALRVSGLGNRHPIVMEFEKLHQTGGGVGE